MGLVDAPHDLEEGLDKDLGTLGRQRNVDWRTDLVDC